MHNIDRTNLESNYGEFNGEYAGEYGNEFSGEFANEYPNEFGQEMETYGEYSQEGPLSEAEEMELAAELLTVQNEAELEQFLGKLIKKAGGFLKSGIGRQITGALKGVAKSALPMLGAAAGNFIVPRRWRCDW
ncbi:MAG: hypothetical protein V7638_4630 [Acidobacteriota bacterium]|jgi:hypothetical protein